MVINPQISRLEKYEDLVQTNAYSINNSLWNSKKFIKTEINLGYDDNYIYVLMKAWENKPLTRYTNDQERVYEDSAMEFFIQFNDQTYFNFEFNRSGALLVNYGTTDTRTKVNNEDLDRICRTVTIDKKFWSVRLDIPWLVFANYEPIDILNPIKINAYKISEDDMILHYQSLFPIITENPNFHTPEFFQIMVLD